MRKYKYSKPPLRYLIRRVRRWLLSHHAPRRQVFAGQYSLEGMSIVRGRSRGVGGLVAVLMAVVSLVPVRGGETGVVGLGLGLRLGFGLGLAAIRGRGVNGQDVLFVDDDDIDIPFVGDDDSADIPRSWVTMTAVSTFRSWVTMTAPTFRSWMTMTSPFHS